MSKIPPLIPPTSQVDPIQFQAGDTLVSVSSKAFAETQDKSVLHDFIALDLFINGRAQQGPLVVPKEQAKAYENVKAWWETCKLPESLSEKTLSITADVADFLCMDALALEAGSLYARRAEIERLPRGSEERAICMAAYADLLDAAGDADGAMKWFRQAHSEVGPDASCLTRHYKQIIESDPHSANALLRLGLLQFDPKTHDLVHGDPDIGLTYFLAALRQRPSDIWALRSLTHIMRVGLEATPDLALEITRALSNAIEFCASRQTAELCCLVLCDALPSVRSLLNKLGWIRPAYLAAPDPFKEMYRTVRPQTQAHPLAVFTHAEHAFFAGSRPKHETFTELLDAVEQYGAHDTNQKIVFGEDAPTSQVLAVLRRTMVTLLCQTEPLPREDFLRCARFCLKHADDGGLEFRRQKLLLLAGDLFVEVVSLAESHDETATQKRIIRLESDLRSGQARSGWNAIFRAIGLRDSSDVAGLCYLYLNRLTRPGAPSDKPSAVVPYDVLKNTATGFTAASFWHVRTARSFDEIVLTAEAQQIGTLAYFCIWESARRWPEQRTRHFQRRGRSLYERLDRVRWTDAKIIRQLAWCAFWLNQFQEAIRLIDHEADLHRRETFTRPVKALSLLALGRPVDATRYIVETQRLSEDTFEEDSSLTRYVSQLCDLQMKPPGEQLFATLDDALRNFPSDPLLEQELFLARAQSLRRYITNIRNL